MTIKIWTNILKVQIRIYIILKLGMSLKAGNYFLSALFSRVVLGETVIVVREEIMA